jgi:hypothetical protein
VDWVGVDGLGGLGFNVYWWSMEELDGTFRSTVGSMGPWSFSLLGLGADFCC